jgi:hypothetical protein
MVAIISLVEFRSLRLFCTICCCDHSTSRLGCWSEYFISVWSRD